MLRYDKNQVNIAPIVIGLIIAIFFAGAFGAGVLDKKLTTVRTYVGALGVYDAVETAADLYVTDCAEGVLPKGCAPTSHIIRGYSDATLAAYQNAKIYGQDAPISVAQALIVAVNALNQSLPTPVPVPAGS